MKRRVLFKTIKLMHFEKLGYRLVVDSMLLLLGFLNRTMIIIVGLSVGFLYCGLEGLESGERIFIPGKKTQIRQLSKRDMLLSVILIKLFK